MGILWGGGYGEIYLRSEVIKLVLDGDFFLMLGKPKVPQSASKCLKRHQFSVGEKFRQVPVSVMTTTGMNLGLGGVDWILRLFFFFLELGLKSTSTGYLQEFLFRIPCAKFDDMLTSYRVDTTRQLKAQEAPLKWWRIILTFIFDCVKILVERRRECIGFF